VGVKMGGSGGTKTTETPRDESRTPGYKAGIQKSNRKCTYFLIVSPTGNP